MSNKDEIDCISSKDVGKSFPKDIPNSTFGVPSNTITKQVIPTKNPLINPLRNPYFIKYPSSMATLSTHTTTVPSTTYMVRPISSPTKLPTHQGFGMPSTVENSSQQGDFRIVRRKTRMAPNPKKAHDIEMRILEVRGKYLEIYPAGEESIKREFCSRLIAEDAPINTKYKELDLESLLHQNLVRSRFGYLVQALGIQEKYASNLIKDIRPQFWRTVKFTSSLWKTYLENMSGSVDILKKMGYTKQLSDGLSFPDEVREPDVRRVKEIAADLYLAKIETDDMINDKHPYWIIAPNKRDLSSTPSEKRVQSPNLVSEDSDSEYEDAKDGLSNEDDNTTSHQVLTATSKVREISSPAPDCFVCGNEAVAWFCNDCKNHFCQGCDNTFHNRHDRRNHARQRFVDMLPTPRKYENTLFTQKPSSTTLVDDGIKKRPVPKPRKRVPSKTSSVSSPGNPPTAKSNSPSVEVLPSPIFTRTVQNPTYFEHKRTLKEKVPQQPTIQTIEREILRPPPVANYKPVIEPLRVLLEGEKEELNLYESLKNPEQHIYETLDQQSKDPTPPPLPPKPQRKDKMTAPISKAATSCPHCYCLNTPETVRCIACGTSLREPSSLEIKSPRRHEEQRVIHDLAAGQFENEKPQKTISPFPNATENRLYFSNAPHSPGTTEIQAGDAKTEKTPRSNFTTKGSETKWACEFCTFLNPLDTKICGVCAKTKTEGAKVVESSPVPPEESPKAFTPESMLTCPSFAVAKLQEEEFKRSNDVRRTASQSLMVQSLQKQEEELLQSKADDNKQLYHVQQIITSLASPTSSYPSVFSSPSERSFDQEFLKSPKEFREPPKEFRELTKEFREPPRDGREPRREGSSYGKEILEFQEAGKKFVTKMKEAESLGYCPEELNIAYTLSVGDSSDPVHWLKTEWFDLVHKVMIKFTDRSKDEDIGNLSPEEARQALIERTGDVERAVELSIEERKKGLKEVMASGFHPRTECISALDRNDGDVDKSVQDLQIISFQPMLQRIWDSCLGDDADGNDERHQRQNPERQLSTSRDEELFVALVSNKEMDKERRTRVILAEKCLISWGRAETAIRLVDADFPVLDSVEAAQAVGDFDRAKQFLQRECILCTDFKPESQMVTMLNCQCRFCRDCVKAHVTIVLRDKNIMKLVCPACDEPKNLDNDAVATVYFNNLDIMIRRLVDKETHDLFQKKLIERTLMKEPNFRWCSHCSSGFINERPDLIKMACPHCNKYTCFKCKKEWEDQHEGITCEQFAAWKEANDPEAQANGLAAHLKQNGIECPNCKFRYDLAKGGCMHFKCNQCSHEFCSGCYQPFKQGNHCRVSDSCARKGIHAHHPRDCLSYLRDRDPEELKKLLDDHNVQYDTEPPQRQGAGAVNQGYQQGEEEEVQGAAAIAQPDVGRCKVMEQLETNEGLQDSECGRETPNGYAGLCRMHFTEYLVEKINANLIDPLGMFDIRDLEILIQRNDQVPPARKAREKDAPFRERLVQFVQAHLPLPKMPPRRRVLNIDEPVAEDQVHLILNDERDGPREDIFHLPDDALINDGFDEDIIDSDPDDYREYPDDFDDFGGYRSE